MQSSYIYGRNPVLEAIRAEKIEKVFISYNAKGNLIGAIYAESKKRKIRVVKYDRKKFSELEKREFPPKANTQGVAALKKMVETFTLTEIIERSYRDNDYPVFVALDEINDPHNLGAIARSVECSGASGMILPERHTAPITAGTVKSSAGAIEHIDVAKVNNFTQALEKMKKEGFWVVGTEASAKQLYYDKKYNMPVVLVIGSEGKGMRPSVKKHCDDFIKIPLQGKVSSLNASVSAGIILFEIAKQKKNITRKTV